MIDKNRIYAVKRPGDKRIKEVILYPDLDYRGFKGICYLTPPNRPHMIDGKLIRETAAGFSFKTKHGEVWEFTEVTYDNLNDCAGAIEGIEEIKAAVSSTEELQDWYHREYPI